MTNTKKPIYKRILLKLSGEALQKDNKFGINTKILKYIAQDIKKLILLNVQIGIVIGGGNLFRGSHLEKSGINRITSDHIGILSTIINSLAIQDILCQININTKVMSSISLNNICENYNYKKAIELLNNKYVVIFSAGTGNPLFTTDSAACLRGIEIQANIILKATKVKGIFSKNPKNNKNTTFYKKISYQDVIKKEIKIMDLTAFTLARDHNLPIYIFNFNTKNILYKIIMGYEKEGTLITN
ncbi:MAG: UMP kinase [Candidatus Westeberhardia cardiocondylae]|nr:UMP kinase [Candidatus Westeberhardia cardiocondylae]